MVLLTARSYNTDMYTSSIYLLPPIIYTLQQPSSAATNRSPRLPLFTTTTTTYTCTTIIIHCVYKTTTTNHPTLYVCVCVCCSSYIYTRIQTYTQHPANLQRIYMCIPTCICIPPPHTYLMYTHQHGCICIHVYLCIHGSYIPCIHASSAYIYIHIPAYTYTYTCTMHHVYLQHHHHVYVYMYMYTCIYLCICIPPWLCIPMYICICSTTMAMYTYVHVYMYTCAQQQHVYIHMYTCIHACIYVYVYGSCWLIYLWLTCCTCMYMAMAAHGSYLHM